MQMRAGVLQDIGTISQTVCRKTDMAGILPDYQDLFANK